MEEKVRDAVFGNVGTLVVFRVGPFDAEVLTTVFEPTFTAEDLVGLGLGQIYLTLMIDGVGSAPFSAETIPPIEAPSISYREDVIVHSRATYGRPRAEMEASVLKRQQDFAPPAKIEKPERRDEGMPRRPPAPSYNGNGERRHTPPPSSPPAPPRDHVPREVPNRNGLSEALAQAQKADTPKGDNRSPIEILRARMAAKPPKAEHLPPKHPPPQPARPPAAQKKEEKEDTGEVSPEIVRRVLNGE